MKDIADSEVLIRKAQFTDVYTVDSEIGRGKFAVVKRCVHRATGLDYAAKFVHKRRKGKDCRQAALREVQMLDLSRAHPHIVDLVEVYETSHELIIVTEYARGGELFNQIEMDGQLGEACVVRLMHQILQGLAFLHHQSILHMDIKPQNILLTKQLPEGDVKLCDLGLARAFNSGEDILEIIGTPDYVAPEVLDYEPLGPACDMWSIGVLAYVMLTGCSPFAGDTKQETFLNISQVNLDFPPELFASVSARAVDFIQQLLVCDPRERLTAKECLEHAWIRDVTPTPLPSLPDVSSSSPHCALAPPEPPCVGSPSGHRRSLPKSPTVNDEPTKKLKCSADRGMSAEENGHDDAVGYSAKCEDDCRMDDCAALGMGNGDEQLCVNGFPSPRGGGGADRKVDAAMPNDFTVQIAPAANCNSVKENSNHSHQAERNHLSAATARVGSAASAEASDGMVTSEEGISTRVVRRRPTIPKKPVAFCRPATNGVSAKIEAKPLRCSGSDQVDIVESAKIMV